MKCICLLLIKDKLSYYLKILHVNCKTKNISNINLLKKYLSVNYSFQGIHISVRAIRIFINDVKIIFTVYLITMPYDTIGY